MAPKTVNSANAHLVQLLDAETSKPRQQRSLDFIGLGHAPGRQRTKHDTGGVDRLESGQGTDITTSVDGVIVQAST